MTNEQKIWDYLISKGLTQAGAAGLMGNMYAQSGMIPNRVQILCLKRLKQQGKNYNDKTYTDAVDKKIISKLEFLNPLPNKQYGYGLCQWTSPQRKSNLYDLAQKRGKSIGNLEVQLEFLITQLKTYYKAVWEVLTSTSMAREASNIVLEKFQIPANLESLKEQRANYSFHWYNEFHKEKKSAIQSNDNLIKAAISKYDKYIYSKDKHYISNSGHDENGSYKNGKAGDQTGDEWCLRSWYNRPWNCVLRYQKNKNVGLKLAQLGCSAALNNFIGYDQYQRDTYWQHLVASNYDPSKITVPCQADCSAGVIANTKAVGFLLNIDALKNINATYTGNMREAYRKAGFVVLTESKYLLKTDYLLPGDILLNDQHHTATNITYGTKINTTQSKNGSVSVQKKDLNTIAKEVIQGKWGYGQDRIKKLTNAGYDYNKIQNTVNELFLQMYGKY